MAAAEVVVVDKKLTFRRLLKAEWQPFDFCPVGCRKSPCVSVLIGPKSITTASASTSRSVGCVRDVGCCHMGRPFVADDETILSVLLFRGLFSGAGTVVLWVIWLISVRWLSVSGRRGPSAATGIPLSLDGQWTGLVFCALFWQVAPN